MNVKILNLTQTTFYKMTFLRNLEQIARNDTWDVWLTIIAFWGCLRTWIWLGFLKSFVVQTREWLIRAMLLAGSALVRAFCAGKIIFARNPLHVKMIILSWKNIIPEFRLFSIFYLGYFQYVFLKPHAITSINFFCIPRFLVLILTTVTVFSFFKISPNKLIPCHFPTLPLNSFLVCFT